VPVLCEVLSGSALNAELQISALQNVMAQTATVLTVVTLIDSVPIWEIRDAKDVRSYQVAMV
jgi:hypothetical protein